MPARISGQIRNRLIWGIAFAVVILGFFLAENYVAFRFSKCISQMTSYQAAERPQQHGLIISNFIWAQGVCSLSLIDRHNGFFSLIGTAAIAGFTFILWRATDGMLRVTERQSSELKRSIEAAEKSASVAERALTELERPWLLLEGYAVRRYEPPSTPNAWYITFEWRNFGRSPALIKECVVRIVDRDLMPPVPDYEGSKPLLCPAIVGASSPFATGAIGPSRGTGIKDGNAVQFIVFGKLTYSQMNGTLHHSGFAGSGVAPCRRRIWVWQANLRGPRLKAP